MADTTDNATATATATTIATTTVPSAQENTMVAALLLPPQEIPVPKTETKRWGDE